MLVQVAHTAFQLALFFVSTACLCNSFSVATWKVRPNHFFRNDNKTVLDDLQMTKLPKDDETYDFCCVDQSIARVLSLQTIDDKSDSLASRYYQVDNRRLCIIPSRENIPGSTTTTTSPPWQLPVDELILLAQDCQIALDKHCGSEQAINDQDGQADLARDTLYQLSCRLTTVSTLLALNRLEAAIVHLAAKKESTATRKVGRAPLLTQVLIMLGNMAAEKNINDYNHDVYLLLPVLKCLLLPSGLNLRNLVWHGFVGKLPRAWLALLVVLIDQIENIPEKGIDNDQTNTKLSSAQLVATNLVTTKDSAVSLRSTSPSEQDIQLKPLPLEWQKIAALGQPLFDHPRQASMNVITAWLAHDDHIDGLWNVVVSWLEESHPKMSSTISPTSFPAAITCAILIVLLEHGLRRDWCRCNNSMANDEDNDLLARQGRYYVTLDGHGQRCQHDLLLYPYRLVKTTSREPDNDNQRSHETRFATIDYDSLLINQLLYQLGGQLTALLTDLYVSPHGPNLRAALAHGSWNHLLQRDLAVLRGQQSSAIESKTTINGGDDGMRTAAAPTALANHVIVCDYVKILLFAMKQAAEAYSRQQNQQQQQNEETVDWHYLPLFSYSAYTRSNLVKLKNSLSQLASMSNVDLQESLSLMSSGLTSGSTNAQEILKGLYMSKCFVDCSLERLVNDYLGYSSLKKVQPSVDVLSSNDHMPRDNLSCTSFLSSRITIADLLREHTSNRLLASYGAARRLVEDVNQAISDYLETRQALELEWMSSMHDCVEDDFDDGEQFVETVEQPSVTQQRCSVLERRRRRVLRVEACAGFAWHIYTFAAWIALLSLEQALHENNKIATNTSLSELPVSQNELVKSVERTRMVVSTVKTFLTNNSERAFTAATEYAKGKLIKKLIAYKDVMLTTNN